MTRMIRNLLLVFPALTCVSVALSAQAPSALPHAAPTIDQMLSLQRAASPAISPDGRRVAYTVRETNWDDNSYDMKIWLADTQTGTVRQLTGGRKSSTAPAWSPDGSMIAFISDRTDKRQLYLINLTGGEAEAITTADEGISDFEWSPDGRHIAYTAQDARAAALKDREKKYGEFEVIDQEHRMEQLFVFDLTDRRPRPLTSGPFVVGAFDWSPDSMSIAFDHRVNSDPASSGTADISVVTVADGRIRDLVTQDGPDSRPVWSPDCTRIAFQTAMANPNYFYSNQRIAAVAASGGPIEVLTPVFDEDPQIVAWKRDGIFFAANSHTWSYLYRVDPTTKGVARYAAAAEWIGSGFSLSQDGSRVAFTAADAHSMAEVYVGATADLAVTGDVARVPATLRKISDMNAQTAGWTTGTLDVVTWKSQDGTPIEGVLHKPADFDPARKYPLLVVIHGGPTGVSRPIPFSSSIYPIDVWVSRGVLVLEPNYRGSAGYGEKFRALNVRNLGVGDAWDVLSGVDSLVARGWVDPARVGTMGWSQGGYISAFLATHDSARFKAVSVGAGISDWMTYYVNTDIHPFTRQYLKSTPWDDPAIYARTSPITYIKQAKSPVLIQHGESDRRVPLPNAFELYQGLQDQKVPVKLIVYKGFGGIGHGPTRPRSHRATMQHNLEWFDEYLFTAAAKPTTHAQPQ